jgi:hypothetical protein
VYFVKMRFRKDFRIIFLKEKDYVLKELSKMVGPRQRCDWAGAMGKMGHGAGPAREEETR